MVLWIAKNWVVLSTWDVLCMYIYICTSIHIYIERESEREKKGSYSTICVLPRKESLLKLLLFVNGVVRSKKKEVLTRLREADLC